MTVNEYAAIWYVHPQVVRRYILEGRIPAAKIKNRWILPEGLEKPPSRRKYADEFTPEDIEARKTARRDYYRQYYQRLKDSGICTTCTTRWAEPGRTHCAACAEAARRKWRQKYPDGNGERCKRRREELKAKGLCINCGKAAAPDHVLCMGCMDKAAQARQARRVRDRVNREIEKRIREARGNADGH